MTVIKRDKKSSTHDLVSAIEKLIPLLLNQKEEAAAKDLMDAKQKLLKSIPGSDPFIGAVETILDAFEGDHELAAYTHQRAKATEWTDAEELSNASSRVLTLARRFKKIGTV